LALDVRDHLGESLGLLGDVLRTPDIRRLGLAYIFSLVGLWAYGVAVSVYAFRIGGATLVGIAAVIRLLPAAAFAPLVAVLADRYPRRSVLISTDLSRALLISLAAIAVLVDLPLALFVLAGVVVIVSTAFEPAKNALLPELATEPEQLTAANVTMSTFESVSIFAGPALGGLLLTFASVQVVFAVTAVLLLCSAFLIARIGYQDADRSGIDAEERSDGMMTELLAGFRVIGTNPRLRLLTGLMGAQLAVYGSLSVLVVVASVDLLGMGEAGVGYLDSAVGIGGLIGAVVTLTLAGRRSLGTVLALGLAGWGIPIVLIGLVPQVALALALMGVIGVANTVIDSTANTLLQRCAPEEAMARVFGVLESVVFAAIGLGSLLAPLLIGGVGIKGALVVTGLVLPLLALLVRPALDRIDVEVQPRSREIGLLRGMSIFRPLSPAALEQIAGQLRRVHARAGEEIVRQGEPGELFYAIGAGEAEVFEDGRFARREGPGEHFGEIALLRDVARTATVIAKTDLELFTLGRDDFLAAISGHSLSSEAAEAVVATRLGSTRR
jgi:MFS family permease